MNNSYDEFNTDAILLATPEGDILDANAAACLIFGRTVEELRKLGRKAVLDPDDPRLEIGMRIRRETGIFMGDLTGLRRDGTKFPVRLSSAVYTRPDGSQALRVVIRDLTREKDLEERLLQTRRRLQALSTSLPDAVSILDLKTNSPLFFNHPSFLGYDRKVLLSEGSIFSQVHEEDLANLREHWAKARAGTPEGEVEFRIKNSAGEWEWVSMREVMLGQFNGGESQELMVILSVVTERVRAAQQNTFQAALLRHVNDSIVCTDDKFRIMYWNPAAENLFGWKAEEVLGKTTMEILQTRMTPEERAQSQQQLEKTGSWKGELIQHTREGKPLVFEANVAVIHDDRGQTLVLAANREITRRKKAERAVESANRKLKRALEREQMLARIDYLTGAFNRRQFFMAAEKAFAQARRYKRSLALMILDIDHFKNVNDSFGHQVGDQMLKRLTQLMKHELRAPDILARHGGEEFIALLPESNSTAAWAVAERIRQKIEGYNLVTSRGNVFVTVSIGVAEALPEVDSLDRLVAMADEAMYRAKQAGRNKTVVFEV